MNEGLGTENDLTCCSGDLCFVCRERVGATPADEWWNRALLRWPGVGMVFPALGALAPGHVLVVPEEHVVSVTRISDAAAREMFVRLIEVVIAHLHMEYRDITCFEHGANDDPAAPSSSCVEHAHLQVLPGNYGLARSLPAARRFDGFDAFIASRPGDESYLMCKDPDNSVVTMVDPGISQYFRRHICRVVGRQDDWDYALFSNETAVIETVSLFARAVGRAG